MQQFSKISIAREYRTKYGMQMPTLTLAKIMYKENKEAFNTVDHARTILRTIEGKSGTKMRKDIKDKSLYMTEERPKNPWKLPESEESKYEPFIIKAKKLAVLSDIHIPYHSITALSDHHGACWVRGPLSIHLPEP